MRRRPALLAALAVLGGCAHLQQEERGRVTVTPAGTSLGLAPRPADCTVEVLRTKAPERAYDEVATLHYDLAQGTDAAAAQEDLRRQACALGADAIMVTRDFVPGGWSGPPATMTGTAISYRDARERHRAERVQREAARRKAEQERARELERRYGARPPGVPDDFGPAVLLRPVLVRAAPARTSFVVGQLGARKVVWVSPTTTKGHRFVLAPEVSGFVEEDEIELPPPPPRPDAAAPASQVPGAGAVER